VNYHDRSHLIPALWPALNQVATEINLMTSSLSVHTFTARNEARGYRAKSSTARLTAQRTVGSKLVCSSCSLNSERVVRKVAATPPIQKRQPCTMHVQYGHHASHREIVIAESHTRLARPAPDVMLLVFDILIPFNYTILLVFP